MITIDVDEATELTLRCKQNRTFDVTVNLNRSTTGKDYRLTVIQGDSEVVSFAVGNGLVINDQSIQLLKSPPQMNVATGCHTYDLVEISGSQAVNVFFGAFIIMPSYTTL